MTGAEPAGRSESAMEFVLVHGGWQGGWAWDGVRAALESGGHTVFAPTLRGRTLAEMAGGLIQEVEERDLREVVAVGHSGGGPVVQIVADRLGRRVLRTVFLSAWILGDGQSINDTRPTEAVAASRAEAARRADNSVPMDPGRWASSFMQDATAGQLAAVTPRLVPVPYEWYEQPADLPRFFELCLPASYIFLTSDRAAPRERYASMAARLERPLLLECEGSHEAMLTRPEAVAAALLAATGT
ncbi:alpha/beta fold hydrolase [Streptomyces sp. NPDC088725]|uniref:alpha/beta fold hydrolase n=1 Tax=Streptomyces sp. NPDC088725 TaxID=3365873 RepID=UPI003827913A